MPYGIGSEKGFFSMPQIAIDGVKRLIEIPCATPPLLWVETFNMAALRVFWDIIDPDPREIYTKVRGNSIFCDAKRAAKGIAGAAGGIENPISHGLYKLGEKLDFGTFIYWLADEFAEGIYNWGSSMKRMAKCNDKLSPNFADGSPTVSAIPGDGTWRVINATFQPTSHWAPAGSTIFSVPPGASWQAFAGVTFVTIDEVEVPCASRVRSVIHNAVLSEGAFFPNGEGRQVKAQVMYEGQNIYDFYDVIAIEFSTVTDHSPIPEVYPHLRPGNVFWNLNRLF